MPCRNLLRILLLLLILLVGCRSVSDAQTLEGDASTESTQSFTGSNETSTPFQVQTNPTPNVSQVDVSLVEALTQATIETSSHEVDGPLWDDLWNSEVFEQWEDEWLNTFQGNNVAPDLRLDDVEIVATDVESLHSEYSIVLATYNLKPHMGKDSLWNEQHAKFDTDGWIRNIGLFFYFVKRDSSFVLDAIYLHHPFDFEYVESSTSGSSEEALIRDGMTRWLSGYLLDEVLPSYRLEDFSIDQIEYDQTSDGLSKYLVEFSLVPVEPDGQSEWYDGRNFAGNYVDDWVRIYHMHRYIGVRIAEGQHIVTSLDHHPQTNDLVLPKDANVPQTPEEIGRSLYTSFLDMFVGPEIVSCMKLLDYEIDEVTYYEVDTDGFFGVEIVASVLPAKLSCDPLGGGAIGWGSGIGIWDSETGWVRGINDFICVEEQGDRYVGDRTPGHLYQNCGKATD